MAVTAKTLVRQSGVIPYRVRQGRLEVALITTKNGANWTVPKGHIEPHLTAQTSAAKEAYEEAGLIGALQPRSVGAYTYSKHGTPRHVRLFLMSVTDELAKWPEQHCRRRRWMSLEQASAAVRVAGLRECLVQVQPSSSRKLARAAA